MKKFQQVAFAFGIGIIAVASATPALAQSANLDFGRGNTVRVGPSGTTFGFNGNTVNVNNSGGANFGAANPISSNSRTYDLNPAFPAHGMRNVPTPFGSGDEGAQGNQFNSSGTSGVMGRSSEYTPGELANHDRTFHNYEGRTDSQQTPMGGGSDGGGLPRTMTGGMAQYSPSAYDRIPSGNFRYGFNNQGSALLKSPASLRNFRFGGFLPQTSTGSLDINTVSR
ncbi:MAG: hypothetical protein IAF58_19110 [Leptolyngbya sp.]|nr:hypothetical protein [Candidatus Melainabacteria bacterium]